MSASEFNRFSGSWTSIALASMFSVLIVSCSTKRGKDIPVKHSQRPGNLTAKVAAKYFDDSPSVSKDGTKILFRSGRDSGVSRVYKATFSAGAWSAPEKLSSSSGLISESIAKISPDGTKALLQGSTSVGKALSICDITAGTCSVIASTPWKYGKFEFSPDSAMFYFMKGSEETGAGLYVAMTSAPANAIPVGDVTTWTDAFWTGDATYTYGLISATTDETTGRQSLTKWAFNAPVSNIATALESNLGADISHAATLDPYSASTARFSVTLPVGPSKKNVVSELGSYAGADKKSSPVRSELHTWLANGTDEGATSASLGYRTWFAWISGDDATIFTLNSVSIRCGGDAESTDGKVIALVNRSDNSVIWRHLKIPTDLSKGPSVTDDPCDRAIDGATTTMDMSLDDLVINRDATAATHTMVWTSTMTGDPEVFASVTTGGTTTVYNVSGNRK